MNQPPYDQLYIYELAGDARPGASGLGPGFLGCWLEDASSFLFFSAPADPVVDRLVDTVPGLVLRERHHLTYEQWQGGLELEPIRLPGLTVLPAWQQEATPAQGPLLRLDPGLVFGNGLHPTTRHCLESLLAEQRQEPLGAVLDLGCGTGILGLAAACLGANPVRLVDLNPLCVQTTLANAGLNQLAVEVEEGPAQEHLAWPADLILANLHWQAMSEVVQGLAALGERPRLILSGITRSQVGSLEDLLAKAGYRVDQRRSAQQTWFTLAARPL